MLGATSVPLIDLPHILTRIRFVRALVRAVPLDPGEPETVRLRSNCRELNCGGRLPEWQGGDSNSQPTDYDAAHGWRILLELPASSPLSPRSSRIADPYIRAILGRSWHTSSHTGFKTLRSAERRAVISVMSGGTAADDHTDADLLRAAWPTGVSAC